MKLKIEREREPEGAFIKTGVFLLLIYSFFIGLKVLRSAYIILLITAIVCILISEKTIYRNQQRMATVALFCVFIIVCNRNARIMHGSYALDFLICLAFILYYLIYTKTNWYNIFIKSLIVLGVFYGITTIYLYLFPDVYYHYVVPLFGNDMVGIVQKGYAAGFSKHHSTTAIYHAVTLGIPICVFVRKDCFEKKQRKYLLLLSAILYVGILLTGKRAHSIFIPICVIICYYFFSPDTKISTKAKIFGGVLLFLGILYICIQMVPSLNNVFIRFQSKIEKDDITSGRDILLQDCVHLFSENPIIGSGWGKFTYYSTFGVLNAHNVYAQLVAENGVLLSIPFYVFIFGNGYHTVKAVQKIIRHKIQPSKSSLVCLVFSLYIQVFFIMYCFTGNPLYDFQVVYPYMLGCAIGEKAYNDFAVCDRALEKSKSWKYLKTA